MARTRELGIRCFSAKSGSGHNWSTSTPSALEIAPEMPIKGQRLAMIAARSDHNPLHLPSLALEPVEINNATGHLTGTNRGVVLVRPVR